MRVVGRWDIPKFQEFLFLAYDKLSIIYKRLRSGKVNGPTINLVLAVRFGTF